MAEEGGEESELGGGGGLADLGRGGGGVVVVGWTYVPDEGPVFQVQQGEDDGEEAPFAACRREA